MRLNAAEHGGRSRHSLVCQLTAAAGWLQCALLRLRRHQDAAVRSSAAAAAASSKPLLAVCTHAGDVGGGGCVPRPLCAHPRLHRGIPLGVAAGRLTLKASTMRALAPAQHCCDVCGAGMWSLGWPRISMLPGYCLQEQYGPVAVVLAMILLITFLLASWLFCNVCPPALSSLNLPSGAV